MNTPILSRTRYQQLLEWKAHPGRKPLICRGARQVGKTTLINAFAAKEYPHAIRINFERAPRFKRFFQEDLDPMRILKELGATLSVPVTPDTLLFLDEIQECPPALNSLKYFCEECREQPVIAAGSLLGVKLKHERGFPVGKVQFLDLFPLSFIEFLRAIDKADLADHLQDITLNQTPSTGLHQQYCKYLRDYFFVGGMPEAIVEYVHTKDLTQVREVQLNILDAYQLDFVKHAEPDDVMKITQSWQSLPAQLAKANKKFKYSVIQKSARNRGYESALTWLNDAGLTLPCYRVNAIKHPISAYHQPQHFKLYVLDVGLLGALSDLPPPIILQGDDLFTEFKGAYTENFVAQELMAQGVKSLYFWTIENRFELDFMVQHATNIIPLEVKAGTNLASKSMQHYQKLYPATLSLKTSLHELKAQDHQLNIPLYLLSELSRLLDTFNNRLPLEK